MRDRLRVGDGRLAELDRAGALTDLAAEDFPDHRQREQVRHDQRQPTILVELAKLVTAQVLELFLIDHLETAIDEWLVGALRLDSDFAVHQQARFLKLVHESLGAMAGLLELLAELQDRLGRFRRLLTGEQRLAFVELANRARGRIEAKRQLVAIVTQTGKDERISAQIGWNIDIGLAHLALLVEEGVGAFVKSHQRDWNAVVAGREYDREMTLGHGKFIDRHRNGVGHCNPVEAAKTADLEIGMGIAVKRLKTVIKKRQHVVRRLARHGIDSVKWGGLAREASSGRPAKTAGPPLVAGGLKCKRLRGAKFQRDPDDCRVNRPFNACR